MAASSTPGLQNHQPAEMLGNSAAQLRLHSSQNLPAATQLRPHSPVQSQAFFYSAALQKPPQPASSTRSGAAAASVPGSAAPLYDLLRMNAAQSRAASQRLPTFSRDLRPQPASMLNGGAHSPAGKPVGSSTPPVPTQKSPQGIPSSMLSAPWLLPASSTAGVGSAMPAASGPVFRPQMTSPLAGETQPVYMGLVNSSSSTPAFVPKSQPR